MTKGPIAWIGPLVMRVQCDVPMVVEVAGIEPASADGRPGLLRVQCAMDFLGPSARTHTSTDRPSRERVPGNPRDKGAQQAF